MHILFITENFPPELNAASARVFERALYWLKTGHKVTVVTQAPNFPMGKLFEGYENKWYARENIEGIKVIRVKTYINANKGTLKRMMDFISFMITGFFGGLTVRKVDVVIATSPQFFSAVCGWILGLVKRKPFIFELGDLWPASIVAVGAMKDSFALRMVEKLELFLYHHSAAVVSLTQAFKKDLISRGIPGNKIGVVINGVDLPRYSPRLRDLELEEKYSLKGKFVVGYFGTHGMAHALMNVLNAAEVLKDSDEIRIILMGPGAEREALIQSAKERHLDNVVFIDPVPKSEIPRYWSLLDASLINLKNSPVFETVIPSKTFEAMAMGLPLILSLPSGEITDIVEAEETGLCVPAEEPKELADAILKLQSDKELYEKLKTNSTNAAQNHSRETQANQMLRVIEKVVEGKGCQAAACLGQES